MSHLDARRAQLARTFAQSTPIVLFAGSAPSRNFHAQKYPFRASSHFLYFAGCSIEGAVLVIREGDAALYIPAKSEDDPLWHGPSESYEALSKRVACPVFSLCDLPALHRTSCATIAAVSPLDRRTQERLLRRNISEDPHDFDLDLKLAEAVISVRLVHDEAALDEICGAIDVTAEAFRRGMAQTRPQVREWIPRTAMEGAAAERGMTTAYEAIVSTRGEVLHNRDSSRMMRNGDLLLVDFGAESRGGWASDVTRTWPVSGQFSSTQRDLYNVVLHAQEAAIERACVGVSMRDLHRDTCRDLTRGLVDLGILSGDVDELVADGVHALLFPHGLGHLLGLDVHDMEDLGDLAGYAPGRVRSDEFGLGYLRMDRDLAPGMIITIEPGLYQVPAILERPDLVACAKGRLNLDVLAHFSDVRGIRIEDDILIAEEGPVNLTSAIPKDASDVEMHVGLVDR